MENMRCFQDYFSLVYGQEEMKPNDSICNFIDLSSSSILEPNLKGKMVSDDFYKKDEWDFSSIDSIYIKKVEAF